MGQTLEHGIYLPDEGERNCYSGLAANWQLLDGAVGTVANHTTQIAGKAPAVHTHTKSDITDFPAYGNTAGTICEGNDSRLSDARTPVAHTHTKSDVTDLLNSNFIPSANNSYDLGSSSYQWNNLYAKNYYYNGVAWGLGKANEWSKTNKFSVNISPSDITGIDSNTMAFTALRSVIFFNTTGSSNRQSYGTFLYSGYTAGSKPDNYGQLQLLRSTDKKGETNNGLIPDTTFRMWRVAPHYLLMDFMENARVTNDGTENSLKPITTGVTDLGTSTNKWKTLNGVNPGALSLPVTALNNTYDISGDITDLTGGNNTITAARTGWIFVKSDNATEISIENTTTGMGASDHSASATTLMVSILVTSGETLNIIANCTSIDKAYLLPCQGNV